MPPLPSILLVDDDDDSCVLTERLLAKAAIANPIARAHGVAEAKVWLKAACERRALPGVVLLDVELPGESGFDLLKWVRLDPALCSLKVIMWTASPLLEHYVRSRELRADGLLLKYGPGLGAAVQACLGNDHLVSTPAFAATAPERRVSRRTVLEQRIADYRRVIAQCEASRERIIIRRRNAADSVLAVLKDRMETMDRTLTVLRRSLAAAEEELQQQLPCA